MIGPRHMFGSRRRSRLAAIVALALLASGASALAFWSASSSGTGSGTVGGLQAITLSAGTPLSSLFPGARADVAVSVSNPNRLRVHIGSLSLATSMGAAGFAVDGAHSGCGLQTLSFSAQNNGGAGWFVPAKVGASNGSLSIDLAGALSMGTDAANACQGASFTIYLQASA